METPASALHVGASFDTLQELKDACKLHSIENAFEFKVMYANKSRYTICCKAEGCHWRLHASTVAKTSLYRIKTYQTEHSCFGLNHPGHSQVSRTFIAKQIAERVKDQPSYRPKDIVKDVQRDLGVKISYTKAFRAKARASELNNGTHDAAYQTLPKYCQDIITSNPGSIAILEKTPENKFSRLFVCYSACATGFVYCRPVLGLDGTHLKHKYQGNLGFYQAKKQESFLQLSEWMPTALFSL